MRGQENQGEHPHFRPLALVHDQHHECDSAGHLPRGRPREAIAGPALPTGTPASCGPNLCRTDGRTSKFGWLQPPQPKISVRLKR
jgi:hypothetical protein